MATPRLLLVLVPALLAASLAAQSPGGRTAVGSAPSTRSMLDRLPPPTYRVITMDTLSDETVFATVFDLDPSFDPSRPSTRPVMVGGSAAGFGEPLSLAVGYYRSGAVLDLELLEFSQAWGMNSRGTIVGFAGDAAFRYRPHGRSLPTNLAQGSWRTLPGLGADRTIAWAVNERDIVVGEDSNGWGHSQALYWTPDDRVHALTTGAVSSSASDINDHDVVAGYLRFSQSGPDLAFTMKLDGSGPTLLPAPFAANGACYAEAINNAGDVVGKSPLYGAYQPVLWSLGQAIPLPVLPDEGTGGARAYDINDHGVIVGVSNWEKAVVWIGGAIYDLNELTPDFEPFLTNARAINDQGVIACDSYDDVQRAVLLVPIP